MDIDARVPWAPDFAERSPLFEPLRPWAAAFAGFGHWPGLSDYQRLLDGLPEPIRLKSGQALLIAPQAGRPECFAQHYAPRIYLSGEVQTRTGNWHDFFQFLTWFVFPRAKAEINALHLPHARARLEGDGDPGRRSPLENTLSLFDEGGAVVVASDPALLERVRTFRWKDLFWRHRAELGGKFRCIAFGHALYEKALMPYLGMTANTILVQVEPAFFASPEAQQLAELDQELARRFAREEYRQPRDLAPFPILGMPGWYPGNDNEAFYDNTDYFRPGRRKPGTHA